MSSTVKSVHRTGKSEKKIIFTVVVCLWCFFLCGCQLREKVYYRDRNNYITEEAVVEQIVFDEELYRLYFTLSGIDEKYQDDFFKIQGDSVDILLSNNILDKIKPGSVIIYTSAPHYFGDGYCMPIVEVIFDEEELLAFEDGYNILMKLY